MNYSFILMALSASALPALAILAIFLRRDFFKGRMKVVFLLIGLGLLTYAIGDAFKEHGEELGMLDAVIAGITATITLSILSRFSHGHTHDKEAEGAKGIVLSEAFHSLFDGMVIGTTYLVSPLLGYSVTVGILIHELPKILGTLTVFRSMGLSIKKTITYGLLAQIGSPIAAILVFLIGKRFDQEQFHAFEIASVSSLAAIVLWIFWLEIRFHIKHNKDNKKRGGPGVSGHSH